MSILKIRIHMEKPLFSKLYILKCQKKVCPKYLKSILFSGHLSIGFKLIHISNYFAVKVEKSRI